MVKKSCALAMALCVVAGNFAQAATLEGSSGLKVNQGQGYVAANGSNLKVGDTVRADAKSAGYLVYPDGCRVKVAPGSVSTVRANSPCSFKAQAGGPGDGGSTLCLNSAEETLACGLGLAVVGGSIAAVVIGGGGNGGSSGFFPTSP